MRGICSLIIGTYLKAGSIFDAYFYSFLFVIVEENMYFCPAVKGSPGGEMADALVSGTSGVTSVSVRLRSRALIIPANF